MAFFLGINDIYYSSKSEWEQITSSAMKEKNKRGGKQNV